MGIFIKTSSGWLEIKSEGGSLSFVYNCTGTADSTAIANIVNDFFTNGTAMSMKLIISGTMGLEFPTAESAMIINGANSRGAVCNLDFSNCHIPPITTASRNFLYISNSAPNLVINGLNITTTQYALHLSNARQNIFNDCVFKSTASAGRGILLYGSCVNNIFNNCIVSCGNVSGAVALYGVVSALGGKGQIFNNCSFSGIKSVEISATYFHNNIFSNCKFSSTVEISTENNKFNNCYFEAGQNALYERGKNNLYTNCHIVSSNNYAIQLNGENAKFSNCNIISSTLVAVYFADWLTTGIITFVNCLIQGGTVGILVETSNTNTEVKLIGCLVKGGSTQDIQQTSAASTVRWYIMGNTFSRANIIVNGTSGTTGQTVSQIIYFPTNGNKFSRIL